MGRPKGGVFKPVEFLKHVVFVGHGSYAATTDKGKTYQVPQGMRVVFYVRHNEKYHGTAIDRNAQFWQAIQKEDSTQFQPSTKSLQSLREKKSGDRGRVRLEGKPMLSGFEVFEAGKIIPYMYRLTPVSGFKVGKIRYPDMVKQIQVDDRGAPLEIGHTLKSLIESNSEACRDATIHWAACRSVKQR